MPNLITFDENGLHTATYLEIQNALIEEFRNIYGSDIDISTASADGVYINTLSLLINNILNAVNALYNQLDVNSATGKNLDALCALSNVFRRQATYSTAMLTVKNVGASALTLENPEFVDNRSILWRYDGTLTLEVNEEKSIMVICEDVGSIEASAGAITQTVQTTTITVNQPRDAVVGQEIESDISLRSRRATASRISANTVLEALQAALLSIDGIEDVFIYNNNTDSFISANDNTNIEAHSIYVIIRRNANITIDDEVIGQLIHNKLTPGIKTINSNGTLGTAKSYTYNERLYNTYISDGDQTIYWKECSTIAGTGYAPVLSFTITPNNRFKAPNGTEDNEVKVIADAMIQWLNGLPIGNAQVSQAEVMNQLYNVDPRYNGLQTYTIDGVSVSTQVKPDTCYMYEEYTWSFTSGQFIITLQSSI